jgi:hypothetical protein
MKIKNFLCLLVIPVTGLFAEIRPPETDYCKMLERDIGGEHHGFLAGNKMYYVAGASAAEWDNNFELETIGFTHPMFRDGRARGFGIVEDEETGTGHDCWGWDFYRQTKAAYGTVIVDGKKHVHPQATQMLWRPDRQISTYSVGGVQIREEKFISEDDVLTDIMVADKDIEILFEGESYVTKWNLPGFDGDDPNLPYNQGVSSTATFQKDENVIHLIEEGKTFVKPVFNQPVVVGKTMYSGLSFVFGADVPMQEVVIRKNPEHGNLLISFRLKIPAGQPVTLTYTANDEYAAALKATQKLLKDPAAALAGKTEKMNRLLNEQIPYFRCSDEMAVKTYYYLWSLYFMYFRDIGEGYLEYPHTQTAINNFMGLHLWDSWAYTQAGSWVADKWAYGHGNILSWKFMVPLKNKGNLMPDNFGIAWHSTGSYMGFVGTVEPAWEQYRRSGDMKYLRDVYTEVFRPLYKDGNGPTQTFGIEVNAINTLQEMARELGMDEDVALWENFRKRNTDAFEHQWSGEWEGFYGGKNTPWKDIWALVALQSDVMPQEWGHQMIDEYVMDTEKGFISPVGINTRAADSPPNGIFRCSTISLWLGVDGMFRQGRPYAGTLTTLNHIKAMTREWGYPVAPEAWAEKHEAWGSRYYNWDIALVCPMLEWLAGIDYSLPDNSFTFAPHLPPTWDFIETYTPVVKEGKTHWVKARVERKKVRKGYELTAEIEGSVLNSNSVKIHHEDREILDTKTRSTAAGAKQTLLLSAEKIKAYKTLVWVLPRTRIFHKQTTVQAENIIPETDLRYTTNGSEPTADSPLFPENGVQIGSSTSFTFKAFGSDGATYAPYSIPFEDTELLPAYAGDTDKLQPGLNFIAYEIEEKRTTLPDFDSLKEIGRGSLKGTDLTKEINIGTVQEQISRKENFALRISGYLKVPEDQVYNIHVASDDGSRLFLNGQLVIDLNSSSAADPWFKEGFVGLKAGLHKVDIEYYQAQYRTKLHYQMRPGNKHIRKDIPADAWMRD